MWVEGLGLMVVGMLYVLRPHLFQQLLWPHIPVQHLTPDTAYATAALGFVLTQTVGAVRNGTDAATLQTKVNEWLAARQADVQRQIEHGRMAPSPGTPGEGERVPEPIREGSRSYETGRWGSRIPPCINPLRPSIRFRRSSCKNFIRPTTAPLRFKG